MSPKCECCFIWGLQLICWMLPLATKCHTHYHLHPFYFMLFKFKCLVAKQHPKAFMHLSRTSLHWCSMQWEDDTLSDFSPVDETILSIALHRRWLPKCKWNVGFKMVSLTDEKFDKASSSHLCILETCITLTHFSGVSLSEPCATFTNWKMLYII